MPASPPLLLVALLGVAGVALAAPSSGETPLPTTPPAAAAAPDADADLPVLPPAESAPSAEAVDGVRTFVARFDEDLSVRADLLLEGIDAQSQVVFTVPEGWELTEDPLLELDFAHSAALLADRSHLTVSLGGQAVGSVRLDAASALAGKLAIRLPRDLVQPYNHLVIRAVQHYGATCEDPFDPGLWTRVARSSRVTMKYRPRAVEPDLARLPYPLFDPTGYGPATVSLVLPAAPPAATVDALGTLGLALGRLADYRGVAVDAVVPAVADAPGNAILVGVWGESPEIRKLLGDAGPRPSQGLVALVPNPTDATRAVLVVTGADAEGLDRAALAVASRHDALSGPQARVDFVADGNPPASRRDPKPAPRAETFPFTAVGVKDTTVRGFYTPTVQVPLVLEGDAALRPGGASALVRYSYAAGLDPRLSAMEIRLDGVAVKSVSLDDPAGESGATIRVPLPDGVVTPRSSIDVAFTLFPKDWSACTYASDATLWATVHGDSTLTLPRDGVAHLPDLGRLRHGMWPFTLEDDAPVLVALPDRPAAADASAGFLLAAALGRWSTAEAPRFELRSAAGLDFDGLADRHVVLLSSGAPHALYDSLARTEALALTRGAAREVRESGKRALAVTVPDTDAVVAEVLHPRNAGRAVLALSGSRTIPLAELVQRVTSPEGLAALDGDVALVDGRDHVRTLALSEKHRVGSFPVGVALVLAVRSHWGWLGAALVAGAVGLALARRAWTRAREE